MPRTPEKLERNQEIVRRRLSGEKLESLATHFGISKSRVVHIIREYIRKKKPPLEGEGRARHPA